MASRQPLVLTTPEAFSAQVGDALNFVIVPAVLLHKQLDMPWVVAVFIASGIGRRACGMLAQAELCSDTSSPHMSHTQ